MMILRVLSPLLLCLAPVQGAELTYPSELSAASSITLTAANVTIPYNNIVTRGYNGGVPGPTLRVSPGGTLDISLVNNLLSSNNKDCTTTGEEYCYAATTSFHTHGLHVSSWGTSDGATYPSDDVTVELEPGSTQRYSINIPEYHMGGTHWYHPHTHHATAIQAAGGLVGVIIVEDPSGYLPSEYSAMEEKILLFSGHNWATVETIAGKAQSGLLESVATDLTAAGLATNVVFVNGQLTPTLSLESGKWYRFRNLFAAIEQNLIISETGNASCTMKLLAKDGIYITDLPRTISSIYMFPGGRSDVAVSCTCSTYPCTGNLESASARRLQPGGGSAGPGETDTFVGAVLFLRISEGSGTAPDLPTTTLTRPCYLVDLQSVTVPGTNSGALGLQGGSRTVVWNGVGTSMTHANFHSVGWDGWTPLTTFSVGEVYEMTVTGLNGHPLHTHVNPFQITSMPANSYYSDFLKVGDWHDTLQIKDIGGSDTVTVRQQFDAFTGKEVIHCHILSHEDEGMMNFARINGTEGATWSGAEGVDSSCYRSSFSPTPTPTSPPSPSPSTPTPSPSSPTLTPTSPPSPSPSTPTPSASTPTPTPTPSPSPFEAGTADLASYLLPGTALSLVWPLFCLQHCFSAY